MADTGIYWVGTDNNVYAKAPGGNTAPVTNEGQYLGGNSTGYDAKNFSGLASLVPDPNPTFQSNNNGTTGSGTTGSGGSSTTGPTAAQIANYQNNVNSANTTIGTGITSGSGDYNQYVTDAFRGSGGFNSQQNSINNEQTQNELSRLQGMQGVRDMVSNGIQGGGVMLDNAGAGTSSAGEALARAYGVQGRQQASRVGQQAAAGENQIGTEQGNLNRAEDQFQNVDTATKKADIINSIVAGANQTLTYLNAQAASASLPDQINIAQRIAEIKAQATAALAQYDSTLSSARSANTPMGNADYTSKAAQMFASGTAPQQSFNYTSSSPAQFQNTGPEASSLPIFISSTNNKNNNGLVQ